MRTIPCSTFNFLIKSMLLRIPNFYDNFRCIANKCTDTCCIGWEIDIDENSAKRYAKIKGDFGDRLRNNIENGHFKLLPGDRCPFLRQDGLCDMICRLGESSLCSICREHPRFIEVYGDIMERGLGLCCEEAARLLLDTKGTASSPIAFVERGINDEPDDIPDDARTARDVIFEERDYLFQILADSTRPLNERLVEIINFSVETNYTEFCEPDSTPSSSPNYEDNNRTAADNETQNLNSILKSWIATLGKGESFGPAWDSAYKKLLLAPKDSSTRTSNSKVSSIGLFTERDGEKIIAYLLFRYYAKSLFDGNSLAKVQFAIYFWIILQKFGDILAKVSDTPPETSPSDTSTAKIEAIKLLSKQTEYSEEIMSLLVDEFMKNPIFSLENFKKILTE